MGIVADLVASLKACAKQKNLSEGIRLHADLLERGFLKTNCYIASTLVNMYAKCGAPERAVCVLDQIAIQDTVIWNALISGYVENEQAEDALKCLERMQGEGNHPDAVTFICALKAYGKIQALDAGEQAHNEIARMGLLGKDIVLDNTLVDMYCKCGALAKATKVFDNLAVHNVASWNALVGGYVRQWQNEEALECFQCMQCEGLRPNAITLACILKVCGSTGADYKGEELHQEIARQGFLGKDAVIGTALVDMFGRCGVLAKAEMILDEVPVRSVFIWNALIAGYIEHGLNDEALDCADRMQYEGILLDSITFISILKACGNIGAVNKGKEIHYEIGKRGFLRKDIALGNALVDMYAKCGALSDAAIVLAELSLRNVISWNALISGHAQQGQDEEALRCFDQMQHDCISPDNVTFISLLKACGSIGTIVGKAGQIHNQILRQGLLEKDMVLGVTLVDMYAKSGALADAAQVLNKLPVRGVASWNALIAGYVQQGQGEEALKCFQEMQNDGLAPDISTFISILKACGCIGAGDIGEQIHAKIVNFGLLGQDAALQTALVDMYVKCGRLAKALQLLDELFVRDVAIWSALIIGYAQQGEGEEALKCFKQMQHEGLLPDAVTLICVLRACEHSGLLNEGITYFAEMNKKYGIVPSIEHYTCVVDLLGHAGKIGQALVVSNKIASCDQNAVWHALLRACRECGNLKLGRSAFDNAVEIHGNVVSVGQQDDFRC